MLRLLLIAITGPVVATGGAPPVILFNGLAGSEVQAKWEDLDTPHFYCSKSSSGKYERLWVSVEELVPGAIDCLFDKMKLRYDAESAVYYNKPGVVYDGEVDFGGVGGLEYLDPSITASGYYHDIIQALKAHLNYSVGLNVRGAPFDWRLAPDGFAAGVNGSRSGVAYYPRVKHLVEDTFNLNGGRPVVLVSHSMGGPVVLSFLQRQSQEWKDTYIAGFVPIAPPFGGSVDTMEAVISGDKLGVPIVPHAIFHPIQSTCASGPWLFPQPSLWPLSDGPLVEIANGPKYYSSNYSDIVRELGLTQAQDLFAAGVNELALKNFDPPGCRVHVLRGSGIATDAKYIYDAPFVKGKVPNAPKVVSEPNGDGTVNDRSLERAREWAGKQPQAVNISYFANVSHFGLLSDASVASTLMTILESWAV